MVLDLKGNAQISICDSKGNTKRARVKIHEMTDDNLEAVITYEDGTTKRYNSIGDLKVNKYSRRGLFYVGLTETAILVGLSDAVIKALLVSGVVIVGSIVYVELDIALKKNKIKQDRYYRAYRNKFTNSVFVAPFAISFKEAKMRVISELDVYTYKDEAAKNLAVAVSVEFEGPEIDKNVYKSGLLKKVYIIGITIRRIGKVIYFLVSQYFTRNVVLRM